MTEAAASPVFAVYFPDDIPKSPREVFMTLKEATKFANSPDAKSNGARFKRFGTPQEAMDFLGAGDSCVSPLAGPASPSPHPVAATPAEPVIPHPSVNRIQLTELKKTIEKDDMDKFVSLIESNPRFLINTSGDTATIVMEGFRFNCLHIAAKNGRTAFVEKLLEKITDIDYLVACYGTTREDVAFRRENILSSYLNTPDKGCCDTPLHIAAKWGHVGVIRALVSQPLMDRNLKNKEGSTPSDIMCSRYSGNDKTPVKAEMHLLLSGCFVALYRCADALHSLRPKIIPSEKYPSTSLNEATPLEKTICSPRLLPRYRLSAVAGPFKGQKQADEFYQKWTQTGRDTKMSDVDKGHERVGRELAVNYDVTWAESWFFLDNQLVDLASEKGLSLLNAHLVQLRRTQMGSPPADSTRRRLDFDDDEDEAAVQSPAADPVTVARSSSVDEEEDVFEDALDSVLDDSLGSLTDRLDQLRLLSPQNDVTRVIEMEDDSAFCTPPSTPPTVFLLNQPTKADNDLFLALSRLDAQRLVPHPSVRLFVDKMSRLAQQVRVAWPPMDSPRRRPRSRLFSPRS